MVDLSILIVSFNTRELTLQCLRSVYEQTRDCTFEVIVVDNASTDGSREAIAAQFPRAEFAGASRNLGFAAANNLAAQTATGTYLLLLNPDTIVIAGAIDKLVRFAKTKDAADAIVGGRTLKPDGSLDPESCHGRPTPWSVFCQTAGLRFLFPGSQLFSSETLGGWERDSVRDVDIVSGCFLLISHALWDRLGGFDASFFMYGEDADLCLRARDAGYRCVICPDASLIHVGGASESVRSDKMVRLFRAKAQLFEKHWGRGSARFGKLMLKGWALSRMLAMGLLQRMDPSRRTSFEAWRDIWRRRSSYAS